MEKKRGYAGAIKNSGSQVVKAPFPVEKKSNGSVKRGNDLRNSGSK